MIIFTLFGCLFVLKIKVKSLLASMKSCTKSKNPFKNPLQEACSGFQEAAWYLKDISKAACDTENSSES
jgi:hypothetical protein